MFRKFCLLFLLLTASTSLCFADTKVFSNLGLMYTDGSYEPWYSLGTVYGYTQGFGFTASSTVNLSAIKIVLGNISGTGNPTISLYSGNADWGISDLLESWTVDHTLLTPTEGYNTKAVTTLTESGTITLTEGRNYWIIGGNDQSTNTAWYLAQPNDKDQPYYVKTKNGNGVISLPPQNYYFSGAFEVDGVGATPAPVPGALFLLGPALAGLVALRRHV
jgi:hypothetical protein